MADYAVEFAPDGRNFQTIRKGRIEKLWDFFTTDWDIRGHIALNPYAKFRLKNMRTGKVIGVLPKNDKLTKVI